MWIAVFIISAILVGATLWIYSATRFVYISGVVDSQKIGYGTQNGQKVNWYTVSIRLENDDPVSDVRKGETLGYIVSREDWEKVWPGDRVEAKVTGRAEAELIRVSRQSSELRVRVRYENGSTVPNAFVAIINERWLTDKNESRAAIADREGRVVFTSLMPDSYFVYVYKDGYSGTTYGLQSYLLSSLTPDLRWTFSEEWLTVTIKTKQ